MTVAERIVKLEVKVDLLSSKVDGLSKWGSWIVIVVGGYTITKLLDTAFAWNVIP